MCDIEPGSVPTLAYTVLRTETLDRRPPINTQAKDTAKGYYDSKAESFFDVWGGEHIHFGIYRDGSETLFDASERTVAEMYSLLHVSDQALQVLDLGSGFGGAARYIADRGHQITCVDMSSENNRINQKLNQERGYDTITILEESFDSLPLANETFDAVWSQEALCHANDLEKVFRESLRVLKAGGVFALGNTCSSESIPDDILQELNDRNSLSLQTIGFHSELARSLGYEVSVCRDMSEHLVTHYNKMLGAVRRKETKITERDGKEKFEQIVKGLRYWLGICQDGYLSWGIWKLINKSG